MKRIAVFLAVIAMAAFAVTSNAQMLTEGTREITLRGGVDFDGAAGTEADIGVGYGVYVMDNVLVGGTANWYDDGGDVTRYGVGAYGEYSFPELMPESQFVPYVGGNAAWQYSETTPEDSGSDAMELTARLGGKYFLSDSVALDLGLNFSWATDDIYNNDGEIEDTDWGLSWGVRAFF